MKTPYAKQPAFTIVELLIVIVVIGILATISIIAYNGITQKAKNTATINAASQSLKMIQSYIAMNGDYPYKSDLTGTRYVCITSDSECSSSSTSDTKASTNATFNSNMATIGTLPKSVPTEGSRWYGILYAYDRDAFFNDESSPAWLRYYLLGTNQQCGIPGVMRLTTGASFTSSTNGYSSISSDLGKTVCFISISGPAHF